MAATKRDVPVHEFTDDDDDAPPIDPSAGEDTSVTHVDMTEPDGDDDDEPDAQRPDRKTRRANRFKAVQDAAEEARQRAERAEQALAGEQAARQHIEQRLSVLEQGDQRQTPDDPYAKEEELINLRMDNLQIKYGALSPDERQKHYAEMQKEMDELNREKDNLRTKKATPRVDVNAIIQHVRMRDVLDRNRDITDHPQLRQEAIVEYSRQVNVHRKPDSPVTADEVFAGIRKRHGLNGGGNRGAAARTSGISAKRGVGGKSTSRDTEPMTASDRRLARARYPELPEGEAFRKYVKNIKRNDRLDEE